MPTPLISVITVTYNSEVYVEHAIRSVLDQTYPNVEYIIVDGASQDATLDIIHKYASQIDKWISEPDDGIADAMNKGIEMASGDYLLFLHSDDYLLNCQVLEKVAPCLNDRSEIVLFSLYHSNNGTKTLVRPRGLGWWSNFKTGVLHQSAFCSHALFEQIGVFDTSFNIGMDYDFFLRAYRSGVSAKITDFPVSVMRKTGVSSKQDWPGLKRRFKEEWKIHIKNSKSYAMTLLYIFYWILYLPYRRVLCFWNSQNISSDT